MIYAQNKGDIIKGPIFGVNYITVEGDGIDSLKQQIQYEVDLYQNIDGVSSSGEVSSSKTGSGIIKNFKSITKWYFTKEEPQINSVLA